MSAALKVIETSNPQEATALMQTRKECQQTLEALIARTPAIVFASLGTVDGRSFAHADAPGRQANAPRAAAIMSSLMGLVESFGRESLDSTAQYNSIATKHGSIVLVRVPSKGKLHTLCLCADASEILAMTIRAALDTAEQLAVHIDAAT